MKRILFFALVIGACGSIFKTQAQVVQTRTQFKVITTIESIVPGGIGRSRMLESDSSVDYTQNITERTNGKDSKQGKVSRNESKIKSFKETKMLNFYSMAGINFQNIASNDALITSMLNRMTAEGWQLYKIISGVESNAGEGDGNGIFITRYIFMKITLE